MICYPIYMSLEAKMKNFDYIYWEIIQFLRCWLVYKYFRYYDDVDNISLAKFLATSIYVWRLFQKINDTLGSCYFITLFYLNKLTNLFLLITPPLISIIISSFS